VGIGNNAPSQLLEVGTTSAGGNISIVSSSSGANGYLSLVGLDGNAKLQIFSETTTAGFYTPASIPLIFYVSNAERARIDSSGRLLVGTSTGIVTGSSVQAALQVVDNSNLSAAFRMNRNDSSGPIIAFGKSRSTSDGGFAVLQSGDELGAIRFAGADGGDLQTQGAAISAFVDGTPGANDMPGRLVFSTTADGAAGPTERLRITSDAYVRLASGTGGIQFNGDTAAANALDDYEEGTFTPTIEGTTTAGTATYTRQAGVYTKVGRQVFYAIDVIYASGTGTGNLKIAGLPFTSGSITMIKTGAIYADNIALTAGNYPVVSLSLSSTVLLIQQAPTGGGAASSVPYDAAGQIIITGHYFV
jgi:hypothetical protein